MDKVRETRPDLLPESVEKSNPVEEFRKELDAVLEELRRKFGNEPSLRAVCEYIRVMPVGEYAVSRVRFFNTAKCFRAAGFMPQRNCHAGDFTEQGKGNYFNLSQKVPEDAEISHDQS